MSDQPEKATINTLAAELYEIRKLIRAIETGRRNAAWWYLGSGGALLCVALLSSLGNNDLYFISGAVLLVVGVVRKSE